MSTCCVWNETVVRIQHRYNRSNWEGEFSWTNEHRVGRDGFFFLRRMCHMKGIFLFFWIVWRTLGALKSALMAAIFIYCEVEHFSELRYYKRIENSMWILARTRLNLFLLLRALQSPLCHLQQSHNIAHRDTSSQIFITFGMPLDEGFWQWIGDFISTSDKLIVFYETSQLQFFTASTACSQCE